MFTIPRAGRLIAAATALLLLVPAVPAAASNADHVAADHAAADHVIVQTDEGAVRGVSGNGVDSFLGIPYAAPPVGPLRWQPPQPHSTWPGVLSATSYGARCAALASTNGARTTAED
jgi:hypothetical protein